MKKLPSEIKQPSYKPEKHGELVFEPTAYRVYNVGEEGQYGSEYTNMCTLNIIDGQAYISGAMGNFTRKCFRTIFNYVKSKGIKVINYKRVKNLKDKPNKVKLNR